MSRDIALYTDMTSWVDLETCYVTRKKSSKKD